MVAFLKHFTIAYFYLCDVKNIASHCLVPFHSFFHHLLLEDRAAASLFSIRKWNTYKVSPSFLFLISCALFFNCDPVTSYLFWRGVHAVCLRTCPAHRCFCMRLAVVIQMHRKISENWIYWCSFSSVRSLVIETSHWCFS